MLTGALTGKPTKLALRSATLPVTLNVAVLLAALVSLTAPVVAVPATVVVPCRYVRVTVTVPPAASTPGAGVANVTEPVALLYVPAPSTALVIVTLAAPRPAVRFRLNVGVVAVLVALVLT